MRSDFTPIGTRKSAPRSCRWLGCPNLPPEVIAEFKEVARFSGYLTGGDVVALIQKARAAVRLAQLDPYEASDEFHKLVLECGAMPSSAESIRNAVRSVKVRR